MVERKKSKDKRKNKKKQTFVARFSESEAEGEVVRLESHMSDLLQSQFV